MTSLATQVLTLVFLQTIFASERLDDNKWHSLAVRRRQKRLLVEVDDEKPVRSKYRDVIPPPRKLSLAPLTRRRRSLKPRRNIGHVPKLSNRSTRVFH